MFDIDIAAIAIITAKDCIKEPAVRNPMVSSAQVCVDDAEACMARGDYEGAVARAKKAIAYTHGIAHPMHTQFGE